MLINMDKQITTNFHSGVLKNIDFLKIWCAQICSLTSVFILIFVLIEGIYRNTGSTVAVGMLMFFYYLPIIVLGPLLGVLADNLNKKKIVTYTTLAQAALVLISLGAGDKIWVSYTIILLYSLGDAVFNPAVGASLPSLVKKSDLTGANSLFLLTSQGTIVAGSLLGGLLLKLFHQPSYIFLLITILLTIASYISSTLPEDKLRSSGRFNFDLKDLDSIKKIFKLDLLGKQLLEAYMFLKDHPLVLLPVLLLSLLQGIVGMVLALLPPLSGLLKIDFTDSSYFIIAPTVFGALLGSYLLNKNFAQRRKKDLILAGMTLCPLIFISIGLIPFLLKYPVWAVIPLCVGLGLCFVFVAVPLQTLIQENTPIDYRGRVFAVLSSLMYGVGVIPMLLAASVVDILGIRTILFFGGTLILFGVIYARKKQDVILNFNNRK